MQNKITIIDYGMGNLRSVEKKFLKVGAKVEISRDPDIIAQADKLVLPGVGHFANGVKNLYEFGIWEVLNKKALIDHIPILGICLGMQLLGNHSEEGDTKGLGWIDANVQRFVITEPIRYKIPHIGWNTLIINKPSALYQGIPEDAMFYFVHSYFMKCVHEDDILTNSVYENNFTSSVQRGNIFGVQFHPEKSHEWGEQILRNFTIL